MSAKTFVTFEYICKGDCDPGDDMRSTASGFSFVDGFVVCGQLVSHRADARYVFIML